MHTSMCASSQPHSLSPQSLHLLQQILSFLSHTLVLSKASSHIWNCLQVRGRESVWSRKEHRGNATVQNNYCTNKRSTAAALRTVVAQTWNKMLLRKWLWLHRHRRNCYCTNKRCCTNKRAAAVPRTVTPQTKEELLLHKELWLHCYCTKNCACIATAQRIVTTLPLHKELWLHCYCTKSCDCIATAQRTVIALLLH